jgi:hypothetical protein
MKKRKIKQNEKMFRINAKLLWQGMEAETVQLRR